MTEHFSLCGVLNLLKPPGMTSAAAVAVVRHLLHGEKIGHAGTLDPEAAGVLPLMIGKATRIFDYLQDKEKSYITEVAFTGSTDTEDAQGNLIKPCSSFPDEEDVKRILPFFEGAIMQRPPNFSALKQDGKRMYALARNGEMPELPEREVFVHSVRYLGKTERNGYLLSVHCGKGFYVRSFCRDIGDKLGAPAHMRFLLRCASGSFCIENAHTLEELTQASETGKLSSLLMPTDQALLHLPFAEIPDSMEKAVRNGVPIPWSAVPSLHRTEAQDGKPFRLYLQGEFLCISVRQGDMVRMQTWMGY